MAKEIYITDIDKERLENIIETELKRGKTADNTIEKLESEINNAKVINHLQISPDIITMNSRVLLSLDNEDLEASLVYPEDANLNNNKLSILSPVGTAILGYRKGDDIEWKVPAGVTNIHIKKIIYQPEASGDYHM